MSRSYQPADIAAFPLQYLKGVGPRLAQQFGKLGLRTVRDLVFYFPRDYQDRRFPTPISQVQPGGKYLLVGEVERAKLIQLRWRKTLMTARLFDQAGSADIVWFNQPFLADLIKPGEKLMVIGTCKEIIAGRPQISCQEYEILSSPDKEKSSVGRIIPLYPLTEGLYQKKTRSLVETALEKIRPEIRETLPEDLKKRQQLMDLEPALVTIHFPQDQPTLARARRRLVFEEFLIYQLGLAVRRQIFSRGRSGIRFSPQGELLYNFRKQLPFELTASQEKVLREILHDMASPYPMNRLLQGDVGSGKTIIAAMSLLVAIQNGWQSALMAPTEILAGQHLLTMDKLFGPLGLKVALLSGSLKAKERAKLLKEISSGKVDLVIGTHALIEDDIKFAKLGLVVIDEQHRFGVLQRAKLVQKGGNPDILVMTATPIPRTLALTCYGDLDKSVIEGLPPGRQPIATYYAPGSGRRQVYDLVKKEIARGRQAFIVYPLVEESAKVDWAAARKMAKELQAGEFKDFRVGLVHGQLADEEKSGTMEQFRQKKIQVLVATTVIEVGIDIPNATVMVVEQAERFGLSALHQLRGRIGRGADRSYCFLIGSPQSQNAKKRLETMVQTNDGFKIAEADLKLRGPGDYQGTRQSGWPEFAIADLARDDKILWEARQEALALVEDDPQLVRPENQGLKTIMLERYRQFLGLEGYN